MTIASLKNGININYNYSIKNKSFPTIIQVNGTFNRLEDWEFFVSEFNEFGKYNFLTFDFRNQGKSTHVTDDFEYDDFVDDLSGIIDSLKIDSLILSSYSSGCAISMDYALKNIEKIKKVIFAAPVLNPFGMFRTRMYHESLINSLENGDIKDLFLTMFPIVFGSDFCEENKNAVEAFEERFISMYEKAHLLNYQKAWLKGFITISKIKKLSEMTPCYFIYGEEDTFNTPLCTRQLMESVHKLNFVKMENCGHALHLERYEQYMDTIKTIITNDNTL